MIDTLDRRHLAECEILFQKGDAGDSAFLIETGGVEILDPDSGQVLARVGQGELVGEIALIDRNPRTATARALEASVVIEVRRDVMEQLLVNTDPIIRHLLNVVLRRFRNNMEPTLLSQPDRLKLPDLAADPLQQTAAQKIAQLQDLSFAVKANQFVLHYQPIHLLEDGRLAGFEALVRWRHPVLGLVPPLSFLPLAEESGLIREIGLWVLQRASEDWKTLRTLTSTPHPFISVNVSAVQLRDGLFADAAMEIQKAAGIAANELKIELTETSLIQNQLIAQYQLQLLTEFGNSIALDDFGTGFSGMENLQNYRFHTLKLDQQFIRNILNSSLSFQIVLSTLNMIRALHIDSVGEGIETPEIARVLQELGCTYGQGYLFGKPMPLDALLIKD